MRLRHHRGSRAWKEARANEPLEQHYLQLDGVTDGGHAPESVAGIDSAGWTFVQKVAGIPASAANACYGGLYDTLAFPQCNVSAAYRIAAIPTIGGDGHRTASGINWSYYSGPQIADAPTVIAIRTRNVTTRQSRVICAQSGATVVDSGAIAHIDASARAPRHLSVGYLSRPDHSFGAARAPMRLVSCVVVGGEATEDEVQAYSLARDARAVWPMLQLWGYWPASLMYLDGGTWRTHNLGSGTGQVPITWSGPTAADLVRLAA